MPPIESPIVYQPSRKRVARFFLGSLVFAVLCVVAVFLRPGSPKAVLAGVVGAPFMLLCAFSYGARLFRRKPELTVTDDGFEARVWGSVPWGEVGKVGMWTQYLRGRDYKYVQVSMKDPATTVARMKFTARMFLRINRRHGENILMPANMFPVSVEEVVTVMQHAHQRFLGFDPVVSGSPASPASPMSPVVPAAPNAPSSPRPGA